MDNRNTIPLFPLQIVVFPGQTVPLHIFEERYKQMFADVRAAEERSEVLPVGIVLGQGSEVQAEIGCTVVLQEVLHEDEDGRLNIITLGARRFHVGQIVESKSYLQAQVQYMDDEEDPMDPALLSRVLAGYGRLVELIAEESGVEVEGGIMENAFQVAQAVALDLGARQQLLAMMTENMRLQALGDHFDQLVPIFEERRAQRRRVYSNGHNKSS